MCVCVCVCVCARACVRACVRVVCRVCVCIFVVVDPALLFYSVTLKQCPFAIRFVAIICIHVHADTSLFVMCLVISPFLSV